MNAVVRTISLTLLTAALTLASAAAVSAGSDSEIHHDVNPWIGVAGSIGGLILGALQLIVGLSLAAFCLKKGLDLLSKRLGGLDIWGEIKKGSSGCSMG
jgi:CheY-specific phosphatase CheX